MQKYPEAERNLRRATELDPGYAKAHYNLGLVYSEQARHRLALESMERAIDLEPDYLLARLGIAGINYEMAEFEEAETLLRDLAGSPGLPPQSRQQAAALIGLIPERRAWVNTRRAGAQRESDSHLLRGDNLLTLGLKARALEGYLEAIRLDGTAAVAMYQAGTLYLEMGDTGSAARHLIRAAAVAPGMKGVHFALGVTAFREGDMARACSEFEKELTIDPGSAGSHINLAMCYEDHLGDLERAAYHLERHIELTGGNPELREHLTKLKEAIRDQSD
jgi:tetratricopeptide (TPR) repeat protein